MLVAVLQPHERGVAQMAVEDRLVDLGVHAAQRQRPDDLGADVATGTEPAAQRQPDGAIAATPPATVGFVGLGVPPVILERVLQKEGRHVSLRRSSGVLGPGAPVYLNSPALVYGPRRC